MTTVARGRHQKANRSGKPDPEQESMTRAILSVKMNDWNPATIVYQQGRFQ
jgi:hypothetical protein